ncbi:MAG: quinone-interacting membrane-bound oxidoreductase complex subunit QmoC [Actinomycetota bacterium]|nr:quinone-interacting membrane-bound oxidoreductase complex subunit QmoC [Actinomycetota bacterium]
MSTEFMVEPDLNFIKDMQRAGGDSLKKCFQCATCSVVCKLTPDDKPFPRKEMIWAQWGQKDKLMSDPDVWLCHQCNDCTAKCPRGAKPGDVLAAVRNAAFKNYAFPSFMGTWLSRPAYLPLVLGIPALILLFMINLWPTIYNILPKGVPMFEEFKHAGWGNFPAGPIVYKNFYPELGIDITFMTFAALAIISLIVGIGRFWKAMVANHGTVGLMGAPIPNLIKALPTILKHNRFQSCGENKERYYGHLGVFYGFVGLFVTTMIVATAYWFFGVHTPYKMSSPVKFIANISAAALFIGSIIILVKRFTNTKSANSYYDWALVTLVFGLAVTGWGAQFARLADMKSIAYQVYFLHLLFIAYLFLYLPFSKMAHLAYRTVAMVFARQAQRDLVSPDEVLKIG